MRGRQAVAGQRRPVCRFVGQSRPQSRMWSFTVVMGHPLRQGPPQMLLVERNHPIKTLAPGGPYESLAEPVGLRRVDRRLQHPKRHGVQRLVNRGREDAVAIVYEDAIGSIDREAVSELLDRPLSGRMPSQISMHDSAGRDVQDDEDVEELEGGGHHHQEVASQYRAGMIVKERGPRLRARPDGTPARHVASHRSRRHGETKFQPELRCDPLLAPRSIGRRHFGDQLLYFGRNPGTTAGFSSAIRTTSHLISCRPDKRANMIAAIMEAMKDTASLTFRGHVGCSRPRSRILFM